MVELAPFRAIRFSSAVPRVARGDRFSTAPLMRRDANGSYRSAVETYRRWWAEGLLTTEKEAGLWLLDIRSSDGETLSGLVGELTLDESVSPHEEVQPRRVAERLNRLRQLPVDLSPITVYTERAIPRIESLIAQGRRASPDIDVRDEDGGRFRLWRMGAAEQARAALAGVRAVVADGHHRMDAARLAADGDTPAATLAFVIPREPRSRAVHRWLHPTGATDVATQLRHHFRMEAADAPGELRARLCSHPRTAYGLYLADGGAFLLVPLDEHALRRRLPATRSPLWRSLDQTLWDPVLVRVLTGITAHPAPDLEVARRRLRRSRSGAGRAQRAALLVFRPIPTNVITELAVEGEPLPPKVTWFYPKPRTGLLLRSAHGGA